MVLLHDVVPHVHLGSDIDHSIIVSDNHDHHSHEHSHSQDHGHDHEENEDIGLFHSLGHLFGDGFHSYESSDHLVHFVPDTKLTPTKLKIFYAVILSFALFTNESIEKEKRPSFFFPPYEQDLYTDTPLRAPPFLA